MPAIVKVGEGESRQRRKVERRWRERPEVGWRGILRARSCRGTSLGEASGDADEQGKKASVAAS